MSQDTTKEERFFSSFAPFSRRENENELLCRHRKHAWEKLEKGVFPDKKHEQFRHIHFLPTLHDEYTFFENKEVSVQSLPETTNSHLVFVNGSLRLDLSSTSLLSSCVIRSYREASKTFSTLLENTFSKNVAQEHDFFALLNAACFQDGLFLYIPPKCHLTAPIEIINIVEAEGRGCVFPKVFLFAGAHSKVSLVCSTKIRHTSHVFINSSLDVHVDEGASVDISEVLLENASGGIFQTLRSSLQKAAHLRVLQFAHGETPVRFDTKVSLQKPQARADLSGLWINTKNHETHANVCIDHQAEDTQSNQLFKGVLFDQARSSFQGKIFVQKEAQKTAAYQLNNNLVLSDHAQAFSKPGLEIFADDVKASHGATFGQLDIDQLFYLRARGYSELEAKKQLIRGFCNEVSDTIALDSLKTAVTQCIA